ncbi:MAG: PEP-CTERM sorting domain-containing protein [Gammaproteobacteria bacterium]|nr:PEP-CTERM sorting domain-containing protein [Gammaproteobacteria bacterium]
MEIASRPALVYCAALCIASLTLCLSQSALAMTTNLVTFGEFEGIQSSSSDPTVGPISPSGSGSDWAQYDHDVFNAQYPQWSTQASNDFQIQPQGSRTAPSTGADGNATGNYLEILSKSSTGVVTLTVSIPTNIATGSNNATLQFESFSQDPADYQNTGRYQIVVTGGSASDTGLVTINNLATAWKANSIPVTVSPGDTVAVSWSETNNSKQWEGLRIDDVQLLVTLTAVPEPATFGALLLGVFFILTCWNRRKACY